MKIVVNRRANIWLTFNVYIPYCELITSFIKNNTRRSDIL